MDQLQSKIKEGIESGNIQPSERFTSGHTIFTTMVKGKEVKLKCEKDGKLFKMSDGHYFENPNFPVTK